MANKNNSSLGRTRNYATVVYPESAPQNWLDILRDLKFPCYVSPLHDKDINPGGEPKKPHYHVMFCFDGVKSKAQAQEIIDKIGGVGCEVVNSHRGYARYLCHLDNPEKAQYDTLDVTSLNGADYQSSIGLPSDKYKCIREMKQWCKDNDNYYFCDLFDYADEFRQDWFVCLCDSSSFIMKEWLKSHKYKMECESEVRNDDVLHRQREMLSNIRRNNGSTQ